jgi:predicted permease
MTAGAAPDIYVPYTETALEKQDSGAMVLSVVGRLRNGVTIDRALADLQRLSGPSVTVVPLIDRVLGPAVRGWLYLALAAVACVLCIACTNVAILLLVRGLARLPEFAIKRALGASTSVLVGRSLFEGLTISCGAGILAALLASWMVPAVKSWIPDGFLPRLSAVTVDGRVFIACFVSALICGLSFGSAPAWLSAKANLLSPMKGRSIVVAGGTPRNGIMAWFIIGQIAAVAFLLVVATIVVRSFIVVITSDLGFSRDNLVAVTYSYSLDDVPREQRSTSLRVLRQRLIEAASAVPGVVDVGVSTNGSVPLSGGSVRYSITIADRGETLRDDMLETRMVTPGYFRTLGMHLESGRLLESSDTMGSPLVMLINDTAATRFFPGKTAVGQTVVFNGHSVRIVGVLQSVRYKGPEAEVRPEMYLPADQQPIRRSTEAGSLVFRVRRNPSAVSAAVRDAIRPFLNGSEPGAPKFVDVFFNKITEGRRFNAGIMGVLGFVAIVLSAIGIYGTMAFLVEQQIRTIGVKVALGASRSSVRGEVIGLALRFVALGTTVGCVAAWALSKAFLPYAFGVPPGDVMTFVSVAIIITVTASIATWMPARVASSVDAAEILRQQA